LAADFEIRLPGETNFFPNNEFLCKIRRNQGSLATFSAGITAKKQNCFATA